MDALPTFAFTSQGLAPELLISAIRDAQFDPCQLSAHGHPSNLARLVCPGVCLDFADVGPALFVQGRTAQDAYTLLFVVDCPSMARSFNFGVEHTDGYIALFPPGGVLEATTPEGYGTAALTVPVPRFHQAVALDGAEIPDEVLANGGAARVPSSHEAGLRHLLSSIKTILYHAPELTKSLRTRQQMEHQLLRAFLGALIVGLAERPVRPEFRVANRFHRVQRAQGFIDGHASEALYLEDLAAELGLTTRTVEGLFGGVLGISPMTYLRHRRLHLARRRLLDAQPAPGVIKQAALEQGCWHLGRFARDYRELFGESPSETLVRHG